MAENNISHEDDYFSGDTPQEIIDATILKVNDILKEYYPEHLSFHDGSYTITRGSTQVMIVVRSFTKSEASVECIATVVFGAKISEDLLRFLLRKNSELHFGGFAILFDDTIAFTYSMSGAYLNAHDLKLYLDSVAIISDHYDDIIVDLAGGKRSKDMIGEL